MFFIPATVGAVLFDAVGTLIYPHPPAAEAYHRAGQCFGSKWSQEEVRTRFRAAYQRSETGDNLRFASESSERSRWSEIVAEVFDDVLDHEGLFETLWSHFAEPANWSAFDDAGPAWRALANSSRGPDGASRPGLALGIASNFDGRLDSLCDALPPLTNCRLRIISSQVGFRKPNREFFAAVEQRLGLQAAELLLVGDDLQNDYRGARAAGWQAVLLCRDTDGELVPGIPCIRSLRELS